MTVEELRDKITYSEFCEWIEFLVLEQKRNTKDQWYYAQIAAEIRRGYVTTPNKVHTEDFILKFASELEDPEVKMQASKSAWGMAVKMNLN